MFWAVYIDGSVQDCSISIANALEIRVLHWAIDVQLPILYQNFDAH